MSDSDPGKTLPANDPTRAAKPEQPLAARLQHDQRTRWQKGERVVVETYLEQYPELQGDAEAILELIYHEMLLREECGEKPQQDDYVRRFPQFAAQLKPLFEVHGALESAHLLNGGKTLAEKTQAPSTADLPAIPGYEIVKELGRGGMGVVYLAWQQSLHRLTALKMILAGDYASPQELARFRTEAEALARLQHPHIVQIYEVGEQESRPLFSLEYVDGGSLAQKLAGRP